ncbi:MAG: hypothetical protein NVS4B7_01410 [Ktedonobacteraceae bacterium]
MSYSSIESIDISQWPERFLPAFQAPQHLDVYDMRTASRDIQLSVATLVGLINRFQPRIYLLSRADDEFWLQEALNSVPHTISPLKDRAILQELLTLHRSKLQGLIIYDPQLIDSINIATMLAGQRDAIIVSPAQGDELQQQPYNLSVLADLRTYKWTSRLQAYRWAEQHLLSEANAHLVAGFTPDIPLGIRSFLVATRTFIYWLDPRNIWPHPSLAWLSERCLMKRILKAFPPGVVHLGWFVNEGTGVTMTSRAAKPVLASDFYSNLEVWTSIQPAQPFSHSSLREGGSLVKAAKVYLSFTLSEGDNLQYIQERMLHLWKDSGRGSVPIGWAISPLLLEAAPSMAAYYARTATDNDQFVAGPSGAGYMFPSNWPAAQLSAFLQRTGQMMQHMNLTVLAVLDSNFLQSLSLFLRAILTGGGMALIRRDLQQRFAQELSRFGIRGVLSGGGQSKASWRLIAGLPVYQNVGIAKNVDEAVAMIQHAVAATSQRPSFVNIYVLAWTLTPSDLKQVAEQLGDEYEVVVPGMLLAMLNETS